MALLKVNMKVEHHATDVQNYDVYSDTSNNSDKEKQPFRGDDEKIE